jgi:hypothetical protein
MARIGRDPGERAARLSDPRRSQGSFAPNQQPVDDAGRE